MIFSNILVTHLQCVELPNNSVLIQYVDLLIASSNWENLVATGFPQLNGNF